MARVACIFSVEYYDTEEHPLPDWDKIPHGLSIIAASLERAGHEVRCWVLCPKTSLDHTADEIVRDFACDTLLASAVTTQFSLISSLCGRAKILKPSLPILVGGVHASVRSADCLSRNAIDAICIGEGEAAALAWVDAISRGVQPHGIPGLWIKLPGTNQIDRTPPAPFRTNLDDMPLINYAHWERWVDPLNRNVRVVVGRGCPFSCTYCSNHALRRLQAGPYLRFRSPKNIVAEIEMLLRRFPDLRSIYLEIETIGASIPWLLNLCEHLTAFNAALERAIEFRANFAITSHLMLDDERLNGILTALRSANVIGLNVGLESGSARIRKEILNRPSYSNTDLIRFCQAARRHGIAVSLYMIIGVPTETPADACETSSVAKACMPERIFPSIYYPYPGTDLHQMSSQMRLIDPRDVGTSAERSRVYLKLNGFPRWRVFLEYIMINWRVFYQRQSIFRLARTTAYATLRMMPRVLTLIVHLQRGLRKLRHPAHSAAPLPTAAD